MAPRHFSFSIVVFSLAIVVWASTSANAAERMRAEVMCKPTGEPLVYRCVIKLFGRKTGQPIEGAKFKMYTSMPAMPMAHHAPGVEGKSGTTPGVYHGTFHFEMAGEWMIEIRTTAPARDLLRHKLMVHKGGARSEQGKHEMQMKKDQQKHQ
jgi:hypothetical protein